MGSKAIQTGRYDRKAIKLRIDLEEWVDERLRELYGLGDTDLSGEQEIDLDLVLDEDEDERATIVENILGGVKDKSGVSKFVKELLERLKTLK